MVWVKGLRVRLQQSSRQLHSQRALRHLHDTSVSMPQCTLPPPPGISAILWVKSMSPAKPSVVWWELQAHQCAQIRVKP